MNNLVGFLEKEITDKMSLDGILDVFEKMCQIPLDEDMILFETGTYDFTGESLFYFSLVRQFPNADEEYYQIHVDVLYTPNHRNKKFQETTWNDELDESIFDYIRKSEAFISVKNDEYINVDIFMDET